MYQAGETTDRRIDAPGRSDAFHGAKVAILFGDRILTLLRDDVPGLPWPGYWDLPGGACEGEETPEDCVMRETEEEIGVRLDGDQLIWGGAWPSAPSTVWFFVAEWPEFDPAQVVFGAEGQRWSLAPLGWYMTRACAIPDQRRRLAAYLERRAAIRRAVVRA